MDSSDVIIFLVALVVLLSAAFTLRWQRHLFMRRLCPSEILLLDTIEERNRVCDEGHIAQMKQWRTWVTLVIYAVPVTLITSALIHYTKTLIRTGQWSMASLKVLTILCFVPQLLLIPLMCMQYRSGMRKFLREYLNEHGKPICMNCGYDLRGNMSILCSECGTKCDVKNVAQEDQSVR